jgi:hypothetical protein
LRKYNSLYFKTWYFIILIHQSLPCSENGCLRSNSCSAGTLRIPTATDTYRLRGQHELFHGAGIFACLLLPSMPWWRVTCHSPAVLCTNATPSYVCMADDRNHLQLRKIEMQLICFDCSLWTWFAITQYFSL